MGRIIMMSSESGPRRLWQVGATGSPGLSGPPAGEAPGSGSVTVGARGKISGNLRRQSCRRLAAGGGGTTQAAAGGGAQSR